MKKIFAKVLSAMYPKRYRKEIRRVLSDDGSKLSVPHGHNKIIVVENNIERELLPGQKIRGLNIFIKGKNNSVKIFFPTKFHASAVDIIGDDNVVEIRETTHLVAEAYWNLSAVGNGRKVFVDKNFSSNQVMFRIAGNNTMLKVGEDCMFSNDIDIMNGDIHRVYDAAGQLLNSYNDKIIGNHVWVAAGCKVLKNAHIHDGCILGAGSVLTKTFEEKNAIIAGNPAKVVKKNIRWER